MSKVFFISDLHINHTNMIVKYRKFDSNEAYLDTLISNWNNIVSKEDKVFIPGDITMGSVKYYPILSKLNGNKVFILGNHDPAQQKINSLLDYGTVAGMIKYKGYWITHCPMHPSELRGKKNIHGHTHKNYIKRFFGLFRDRRYKNVCADVLNYTPIEFTKLIKMK